MVIPTATPLSPEQFLIFPLLLVFIGAVLGGLRALLSSPLRDSLLQQLPKRRRESVIGKCEPRHHLVAAAGLLRLTCVVAAASMVLQSTLDLELGLRWQVWTAAAITSGVLLEGFPSLITRGRAIKFCLLFLPALRVLSLFLRPATGLIHTGLRLVGADPERSAGDGLAADLIQVAQTQDGEEELTEDQRRMIGHVIELPQTDAAEVMTPRTDLCAIAANTPLMAALEKSRADGHSRLLVFENDIDHVIGIFYIKDVLELLHDEKDLSKYSATDCSRKPFFVHETMRVPALLEELRKRRVHLAVVVDEYGGTAGVVTIEDLLEEIVGEIEDEHDPADEALFHQRICENEIVVDGRTAISDLNEELECKIPEDEDFDTLAGFLFDRCGCIPKVGQTIFLDDFKFEVIEADDRRVQRVRVLSTQAGLEE